MSFDFIRTQNHLLSHSPLEQDLLELTSPNTNHEYKQYGTNEPTFSSSQVHRPKGKKVDPSAPCYIQQLSVEVLLDIFARLDPASLATVSLVCRFWRQIGLDDARWKDAFLAYFGTVPFKRLRKDSWKAEYILRTHLIRKWRKGRGTTIQFNPKVGPVDRLAVDFENSFLMVASAAQGLAVRCNPTSGKVDRHFLYSTDDGVPLHVNVVALDGQRILWGFDAGYITMSMRGRSAGSRQLKVFTGFHQGPVTALALPPRLREVVLSAGDDGTVRIWDAISATCAKVLMGIPGMATCLEGTKDNRVIVGCANGAIVIWNIDIGQVVKDYRDQLRRQQVDGEGANMATTRHRIIYPPSREITKAVHKIKHDAEANVILVSYADAPLICKYSMNTGECVGIFGADGHVASITAMEWDIVPPPDAVLLQAAMKLRAKIPINNSLSKGDGLTNTAETPIKTIRILAAGDSEGTIYLWDGDDTRTDGEHIKPLRVLRGHTSPISALSVDGCKVVSGSDDGWMRIWEPLSGNMLNVFTNKLPRNFPGDRTDVRFTRVTNIHCNDYRGVATIGLQVRTWDFSPDKQSSDKRNARQKNRGGTAGSSAGPRQFHYEMKQDILESTASLKEERKERQKQAKEMDKLTLGGMSDEEMLAYAMMLSQEESSSSNGGSNSGKNGSPAACMVTENDYLQDDDEALMQAVIASLQVEEERKGDETEQTGSQTERSKIRQDDDEYDEELEYVLKLSQAEH